MQAHFVNGSDIIMYSTEKITFFKTESGTGYAYLCDTNQILTLDKIDITNARFRKELIGQLYKDGIILEAEHPEICWPNTYDEYLHKIRFCIQSLVLEITQQCNLRCDYCIYSGNYSGVRTHQDKYMSDDIIKKSINYYFKHNIQSDTATISFYGGEALLDFDKICMAVEYARSINTENKPLKFFISSNGTTLTSKIISWLKNNEDVELTITLNGDQHDRYRHFQSGKGSLETILSSIRKIKTTAPDLWDRIDFLANIVTYSELIKLREFYKEHIEKPPALITGIYSQNGNNIINNIISQKENSQKHKKIVHNLYINQADPYIMPYYNFNIMEIFRRPIGYVADRLHRTSCCMPFTSALFVDSDGSFGICEKVGSDKYLGSISSGINENAVIEMMNSTKDMLNKHCRYCWAKRLCNACYQDFKRDANGNYSIVYEVCENIRKTIEEDLQIFCEIRERNLNFFNSLGLVNCKN